MKFTVKTINSARYEFDVDNDETVENLKIMIQEKTNIDPARQRLIFLGKVLQNNKKLSEYNVDGKVLHLVECQSPGSSSRTAEVPAPSQRPNPPTVTGRRTRSTAIDRDQIMNAIGADANEMVGQIIRSFGVDASQASVTRQNLDNGAVSVNFTVGGTNDQIGIQIINEATTVSGPPNTTTTGATTSTGTSTNANTHTPSTSSSGATPSTASQPGTSSNTGTRRQGPPANLDRIINHLRSCRDLMQHINCTAPEAQEVVNNTLIAPCIRGQHTAGPTLEEGATPEEAQQRATSRESLETYSHILIDMSDIMQEMVRYMNQYARLLHRDPPLEGGSLTHCQNLVDRMGSMFHEVSHAFHLLSDYSITLNTALPRRLWMAQLTGAQVVMSRDREGTAQAVAQGLSRLRGQMGQAAAGAAAPIIVSETSTTSTSTANSSTSTSTSTTNSRPTTTGGNNGTPFSVSFDIPLGTTMIPGLSPQAPFQQFRQASGQTGGPARNTQPLPRPSLACNSRHRIYTPVRCPVHQPPQTGQPATGHRHAHTHGPRHGHSHSHGPRPHSHGPTPARPPSHGPTPPTTTTSLPNGSANIAPTAPTANDTTDATDAAAFNSMTELVSRIGRADNLDGEQMERYSNLVVQMMMGSRQNQPMVTHWPEIRALMMPSVNIPEHSDLGDLLHIVASNYSFQDFMNALTNNMLFDILYRPMRDHFTQSLFNSQVPDQMQVSNAVSEMIAADRNLVIAFFDVRQNESGNVDERATLIAMVREFVNTVFGSLYSSSRGDIAAGFGSVFGRAFLRFLGLIIAFCRYVNPDDPRNRLTNQLSAFLQLRIPYQTITRDDLYDNYVVIRGSDDTEDEEFVDAEEGEAKEDEGEMKSEEESKEEKNTANEGEGSNSSVGSDQTPVSTTDQPAPSRTTNNVVTHPHGIPNGHINGAVPSGVPSEWKRVMDEDAAKLENITFQPLSDGYLTSLPAKRRRTDQKAGSDNPDDVLKDLLSSSVPKAEDDEGDLTHDPELCEMFRAKLKEDLKKKVNDNNDVNDEQYPCTSSLKNS